MASVNRVILIGNLGRDPETRYSESGTAFSNFSIATARKWKDNDGKLQEEAEWHNITTFGRTAEVAGEYLKKGHPVFVEGRLRTRKWQDKDGNDRYTTEVVAENIQFLARKDDGEVRNHGPQKDPGSRQTKPRPSEHKPAALDDDVPF